jgi:hypothetical protein
MHPTAPTTAYFRRLQPKKIYFKEAIPLCGKNAVEVRRQRVPGECLVGVCLRVIWLEFSASSCTQELQAMFACLKKWEFDDLPCAKFHESYMRCIEESEAKAAKYREAVKKGVLGDDASNSLTAVQFNKLMALYPQPDLGRHPYRVMKRLPTQSYADDIFHRKNTPGKPS